LQSLRLHAGPACCLSFSNERGVVYIQKKINFHEIYLTYIGDFGLPRPALPSADLHSSAKPASCPTMKCALSGHTSSPGQPTVDHKDDVIATAGNGVAGGSAPSHPPSCAPKKTSGNLFSRLALLSPSDSGFLHPPLQLSHDPRRGVVRHAQPNLSLRLYRYNTMQSAELWLGVHVPTTANPSRLDAPPVVITCAQ
jgi:hypothetical protein